MCAPARHTRGKLDGIALAGRPVLTLGNSRAHLPRDGGKELLLTRDGAKHLDIGDSRGIANGRISALAGGDATVIDRAALLVVSVAVRRVLFVLVHSRLGNLQAGELVIVHGELGIAVLEVHGAVVGVNVVRGVAELIGSHLTVAVRIDPRPRSAKARGIHFVTNLDVLTGAQLVQITAVRIPHAVRLVAAASNANLVNAKMASRCNKGQDRVRTLRGCGCSGLRAVIGIRERVGYGIPKGIGLASLDLVLGEGCVEMHVVGRAAARRVRRGGELRLGAGSASAHNARAGHAQHGALDIRCGDVMLNGNIIGLVSSNHGIRVPIHVHEIIGVLGFVLRGPTLVPRRGEAAHTVVGFRDLLARVDGAVYLIRGLRKQRARIRYQLDAREELVAHVLCRVAHDIVRAQALDAELEHARRCSR